MNEKILIIRLSSIGDIIQCSGVPRALKAKFTGSEIHWLVRSDNSDLLTLNPSVDRIISFDRSQGLGGWIKLAQSLSKGGYTHIYDAHNNIRSRIMTFFLKSPFFVRRSKNRFRRFLLFAFKLNFFPKPYLPAESFIAPLEPWGITYDGFGGGLTLKSETVNKVKSIIPQGACIAFAPATAWPKKNWPLNHWKSLVELVLKKTNYSILILGGPKDNFCETLVLDPSRVFNLQGKVSLLESAAVSILCNTLVAGDTGLLHLSEALGKNVVALVGPTPFGYPSRKASITLEKKLWCRPCSKDGSGPCFNPTYQKCMKDITSAEVFNTLEKIVRSI